MNKLKAWVSDKKLFPFHLAIVVLAVGIVILAISTVKEFKYCFESPEADESTFVYILEAQDYSRLLERYRLNVGSSGEEDEDLAEFYAVAKYYEAAFFYKAYEEGKDTERAAKQKELMDAAATQMGEFAFTKSDIDTKLGIE